MRPLRQLAPLLLSALGIVAQDSLTSTDCPALVDGGQNPSIATLPDPFAFHSVRKRVGSKADWACRREEISTLLQKYELGELPRDPGTVSATLDGQRLTVTVSKAGKTISWLSTIYLPDNAGNGPFPAIIGLGQHPNIPIPAGVAVIVTQSDMLASQQALFSRGYGLFYDVHGTNHSAGATVAWTWGVGRLIDALEKLPASETKIDVRRLGITGCSYNGKGALVVGALEPRIKLTIPQEDGTGGSSCWRIAEALEKRPGGTSVQTAREIVQENVWFSPAFDTWANQTDLLPFDHHLLAALIAPRALLVLGHTGLPALGPESQWGCMKAARTVWEALRVEDRLGLAQVGGTGRRRCQFPADQGPAVEAYIGRFLQDRRKVNTDIFKSDVRYDAWVDNDWINWRTPVLR